MKALDRDNTNYNIEHDIILIDELCGYEEKFMINQIIFNIESLTLLAISVKNLHQLSS